jgi:diacylglycerol kinase (ATP)
MVELYIIVNPQAKNGYGLSVWKKAEKELKKEKVPYHVFFTEYAGHAKEIVEYIGKKAQQATIVAVGGDGTLHEVINGVIDFPHIKIGFIPGGSGNDFSRGFSIPKDPVACVQFLIQQLKKKTKYIDLGKMKNSALNEIYFMNNMGVGFDAVVANEANRSKLKAIFNRFSMGTIVYAILLIKQLFFYRCRNVGVVVDGKTYHFPSTWFITVANQPFYGGGMKIAPGACSDDGELNIIVVHNLSKIKFLAVFISVFWGGHIRFKEVISLSGKKFTITPDVPMMMHADGELAGHSPVTIENIHKSLPVIAGRIS